MHVTLTEVDGGDPAAIADATAAALLALAASPAIDAALRVAGERSAARQATDARTRMREAARRRLVEQLEVLERVG